MMRRIEKPVACLSRRIFYRGYFQKPDTTEIIQDDGEFRVLDLIKTKARTTTKRQPKKAYDKLVPRFQQMATDQDWGAVWKGGPRSFHPAVVPLPIRQGYVKPNRAPPGKFANAELMKIPNFLHLTPPVINKQCMALKKFCTPWPKGLETEEEQEKHFPVRVVSSDYVHGLPTIRNPLSRIITLKLKLATLNLDKHARDKLLRLVGDRYSNETDELTIVTDRCPIKKQNYDYAVYLLTALYHESNQFEEWENSKVEADMEIYRWSENKSKISASEILNWKSTSEEKVEPPEEYAQSVEQLLNEGENDYNLNKYKEQVLKMLGIALTTEKHPQPQ